MKRIINEEGFKKAMDEGKVWVTLDCDLTELKNGKWYWEIEKSVFENHDDSWEALAHGTDDDDLAAAPAPPPGGSSSSSPAAAGEVWRCDPKVKFGVLAIFSNLLRVSPCSNVFI